MPKPNQNKTGTKRLRKKRQKPLHLPKVVPVKGRMSRKIRRKAALKLRDSKRNNARNDVLTQEDIVSHTVSPHYYTDQWHWHHPELIVGPFNPGYYENYQMLPPYMMTTGDVYEPQTPAHKPTPVHVPRARTRKERRREKTQNTATLENMALGSAVALLFYYVTQK